MKKLLKAGKRTKATGGGARYLRPQAKKRNDGKAKNNFLKGSFSTLGRLCRFTFLAALTIMALAAVSVLLVGGYLYLSKSDYFAVRKVSISGLEKIDREEILALTGLNVPSNILTFEAEEAKNIIAALPWVESVTIERVMPDTIEIAVKEYHPEVVVNLGALYYMDEKGRPFKMLEPGENPDLPIVSGFGEDELLNPGLSTKAAIEETFWLIRALARRNDEFKMDNVSEVHYDAAAGFTIFTRQDSLQIKVGFGAYEEKFRRLGRVMAYMKLHGQSERLSYINIENNPKIMVRHGNNPGA